MYYFLLILFLIVALFLIVVVLLQRSRGDVGAAFGGMGQGMFGPGGVDTILTKITYWLGFMLMFLAVVLALTHPSRKGSLIKDEGQRPPTATKQSKPEGKVPAPVSPSEEKSK